MIPAQDRMVRLLVDGAAGLRREPLSESAWTSLAEAAFRHKLSALTWRLLDDAGALDRAPPAVASRLRAVYLESATRNALLLRDVRRVADLLGRHGIRTLLLKGAHLARYVYAEPALRSMADLDLMVERERLLDAEALLLEDGYGPLPRPDPVEFCTRSNHLPKLMKPGAAVLELHWTIERPTSPFPIEPAQLWQRARPRPLEGLEVWVLGAEDLLLHLILHASYHHGFDRAALKALVDIRQVVEREEDLDWEAFVTRANAWGAGGFAWATLRLAADLAGATLPDRVFRGLGHSAEDERVVEEARCYILTPPPELPKPMVEVATRQGGARWRYILRRLFPERATLAAHYGVRATSPQVYGLYGVRMVELAARRGGTLLRALLPGRSQRGAREQESRRRRIAAWVEGGEERPATEGQ